MFSLCLGWLQELHLAPHAEEFRPHMLIFEASAGNEFWPHLLRPARPQAAARGNSWVGPTLIGPASGDQGVGPRFAHKWGHDSSTEPALAVTQRGELGLVWAAGQVMMCPRGDRPRIPTLLHKSRRRSEPLAWRVHDNQVGIYSGEWHLSAKQFVRAVRGGSSLPSGPRWRRSHRRRL